MICSYWAWWYPIILHKYVAFIFLEQIVMIYRVTLSFNDFILHNNTLIPSCAPTRSPPVEPFTFDFCLSGELSTSPLPILFITPLWPLQSLCVLYEASIHHCTTDNYSNLSVSFVCLITFKYFNTIFSFSQASSSLSLTLVARNETAIWISLLYLKLLNNNLDTDWWNIFTLFYSKNDYSSYPLIWNI